MRARLLILLLLAVCAGLMAACDENKPTELTEPIEDIPAPYDVSARVGPTRLTVTWAYTPDFVYDGFVVYRSEDDRLTYNRLGTVAAPPFEDTNVRVGVVYWYRIAGLDANGLQGRLSPPAPVRAATYAVIVEDDAPVTPTRNVVLTFTAPLQTQNVRFGPDSTFAGVSWRAYTPTALHTLTPVDGMKTVYAQFLDETGNPTHVVADSIRLDTYAEIESFDVSCVSGCVAGDTIMPAAVLHFRVEPVGSELLGEGEIFIEGQGSDPVIARDDGLLGDPVAGDGIYEVDFTLPQFVRLPTLRMSAVFVDEAGNGSPEVEHPTTWIMSDPPPAVAITSVGDATATSLTVRFTRSQDENFTRYEIYRDTGPAIDPLTSILAGSVTQASTTIFTDSGLASSTNYYYQVYVVNDLDERAGSNVVSGSTGAPTPAPPAGGAR